MTNQCPPGEENSHPSDCQILENYRTRSRERKEQESREENRVLHAKAAPITLLLLDIDGVLTDGSLIYTENGIEGKAFNTQDGLGIKLVRQAGVDVGLITARTSELVLRRANELGMTYIAQGVDNKITAYKDILRNSGRKPYQVCFMGDDWIDLPLLTRVGLAACPANAVPEVKDVCHFITERSGGHGAVRETCRLILQAKGVLDSLLQQFIS